MLEKLKLLFKPEQPEEEVEPTLAATALLFEVAWADHDISNAEIQTIRDTLKRHFRLDESTIDTLIEQTQDHHETSVGVFPYTRAINESLDQSQKVSIVRAMWEIAYADRSLDLFEEHTIRRIADLLYVSHSDFIAAKLAVKEQSN
ncbi:MAG: TerB family tellurite resistance protein [Pseudomonadota bacterium]